VPHKTVRTTLRNSFFTLLRVIRVAKSLFGQKERISWQVNSRLDYGEAIRQTEQRNIGIVHAAINILEYT